VVEEKEGKEGNRKSSEHSLSQGSELWEQGENTNNAEPGEKEGEGIVVGLEETNGGRNDWVCGDTGLSAGAKDGEVGDDLQG